MRTIAALLLFFTSQMMASVEHLPEGLYILTWYYHGKHSVKLLR